MSHSTNPEALHKTQSGSLTPGLYHAGPVFVIQWLFDEAQLTVDNIHLTGQPLHEAQWRYIQNLGQELRSTLRDIP